LGAPNKLHSTKSWKAFHFVMRVLKKGNRITKLLAYTSLVLPILEYESACWDPYRRQIIALDRVQKKAAQFTNHTNYSDWKPWLSVGR
jgi:hypothetical protein